MPSLVAVELTGFQFVSALRRAWDAGDALLPVDPRLPRPAVLALLEALRPAWVISADGTGHRRAGSRPTEDGDALVVATSGTTGDPKGVVLTHDAVVASGRATSARLGVDPDRDRWLACLPIAHVGGLAVVTRALVTGTPLTVHDRFDAEAVDRAVTTDGTTLVSLVTAALRRIDAKAWRVIVLGGDTPPWDRPANTVATYGMTETGSGVVYDGVALDGVEVAVVDGEVRLRAPMVGRAYRTATDDVALTDSRGWLHTGDAGTVDDDGLLQVRGRLADVIVTGGEKVWPSVVERVLRQHPDVAEVAVVGIPDAEWGQRVVAVVTSKDTDRPPALEALRDLAKAQLPAYAAPTKLVLVEALPRTALGKVRRTSLVDAIRQHPR